MSTLLIGCFPVLSAQQPPCRTLAHVDAAQALASGVEIHSGPGILRIVALRDDVLRFTESDSEQLPEDASWAALAQARNARVKVRHFSSDQAVGFDTTALEVRVERSTMAVTVSDAEGHVLMRDADPVNFAVRDQQGDLGFTVTKQMPEDEHYFGLGDKAAPLDRRGYAFTMWNTDAYRWQEGTDPLYKDIPYFMAVRAGKAFGLFLDNTWRTEFDFGKLRRNEYSFSAEGGPLDYYFFYGPSPKQVTEDYGWLTGTAPLPPLWSLGFQQSRYSYGTETELRDVADRLRADKIPADALYMDIDYQVKNRPFTLDATKFPNFSDFVKELASKNFHLVMITDLHIADLPNQGYAPFDTGHAGNHFLKNPDGSLFVGPVWPGPSVFPDFMQQQTRDWWGTLYKQFYSYGVGGFWNDMNEPSVFDTPTKTIPLDVVGQIEQPGFAPRPITQREAHNIMGMLNSEGTFEGLLALKPNQRPFVLTRASYAGGQRYAATWTGDNSSSWSHLRISTPMLESLGLSGFYMVGDDIGGYAGSPQMDLLTKWLEVGAFNPIDRDHTEKFSNPQEPWAGGPEQEAIRRKYIDNRYELMPYLYTTAEEAARTGIPIMRPMFLEFPDATADKHPLDLDAGNQFLFGPDLLVAPPPYPDELQAYEVTFPPVPWYDYWTGKLVTRNQPTAKPGNASGVSTGAPIGMGALQTVSVKPSLDLLPVYVRGGAVIPMEPLVQSTMQKPDGPLELRVYPGPDCHGALYDDDGLSLDYKKGKYLRVSYTCEQHGNGLTLRVGAQSGSYPAWWKSIKVTVYGWTSHQVKAELDGRPLSGAQIHSDQSAVDVTIPQSAQGEVLTLRGAE